MNPAAALRKFLIVPLATALAFYSSIISLELLAEVYTPVEDLDHAGSDRQHRENLSSRTVKCIEACGSFWGTFIRLSGSSQRYQADSAAEQAEQRSKQHTWTAGVDRMFGRQLLGVALGTSSGNASIYGFNSDNTFIERDKRSFGIYYGASLPYHLDFTGQVLFSDYDYQAQFYDQRTQIDVADYEANGYSAGLGLSSYIPLLMNNFDFMVQPSISYMYVKTKTEAYQSRDNLDFEKSQLTSTEWQLAVKWRKSFVVGDAFLVPMGGFSYNWLERNFSREYTNERREQNFFQGLLGLTLQRNNLNFSASYQKTIGEDSFEREQYQVTFRVSF